MSIRRWIVIWISIGTAFFAGQAYIAHMSVNLPDVKYYYTISRDLNFEEGFDRFPEFQNRHIIQTRYYKSMKEREAELEPSTLFLWLVIRNEGEGRARDYYIKSVTYTFKNQIVGFDHTRTQVKYGLLPHSIYPESVVVLLCEHFVPSEGKDPDNFIKENMGFKGFVVRTRTKGIIPMSSLRLGEGFEDNYAAQMWPYPAL